MERERREEEEEEGNPYRSFSRDVRIPTHSAWFQVVVVGGSPFGRKGNNSQHITAAADCVRVGTVKPGHGDICPPRVLLRGPFSCDNMHLWVQLMSLPLLQFSLWRVCLLALPT